MPSSKLIVPASVGVGVVFHSALASAVASDITREERLSRTAEIKKKSGLQTDATTIVPNASVGVAILPISDPESGVSPGLLSVATSNVDSEGAGSGISGTGVPPSPAVRPGMSRVEPGKSDSKITDTSENSVALSAEADTPASRSAPDADRLVDAGKIPKAGKAPILGEIAETGKAVDVVRIPEAVKAPESATLAVATHQTADALQATSQVHVSSSDATLALGTEVSRDRHALGEIVQPSMITPSRTRQSASTTSTASAKLQVTQSGNSSLLSSGPTDIRSQGIVEVHVTSANCKSAESNQATERLVPGRAQASTEEQVSPATYSPRSLLTQVDENQPTIMDSSAITNVNTNVSVKTNTSGPAKQGESSVSGLAPKGKGSAFDIRNAHGADARDVAGSDSGASGLAVKPPVDVTGGEHSGTTPKDGSSSAAMQQVSQANPLTISSQTPQSGDMNQPAKAHLETAPSLPPTETHAMPSISGAQLLQSMQHSEMRVGMQSAEFGSISISTSINHQALTAQISIDHSELGRALTAHMPAMEEKLSNAYGLQAKVEIRDADNSNSSAYSNSGQQSREDRQGHGSRADGPGASRPVSSTAPTILSTLPTTAGTSRLDIRI